MMGQGSNSDEDDDDTTRIGKVLPPQPGDNGGQTADKIPGKPDPQPRADDGATRLSPLPERSTPPPLARPQTAAIAPGAAAVDGQGTVTVGTLINNNYEVREVLKSGGMGAVYRGVEIGTGDPVAIKVILPELAEDKKAGQMFKREARTLRQLSDEAIVRYYNYVHDRDIDRYCLIMEFISGVPLSEYTEKHGGLSAASGRALLRRLARGLDKAHARDVIHRDLSPDNVMLPDGVVTEAVLIDFGIAKSNVLKESTMAGQFAGKFKFVSPEQLGHHGGEIGPQTDVYGLGLLLCAALRGKPLEMGSSIVEAVQSRQTIPDLSDVPDAFRPLLSYMLEPDPADRPPSMKAVLQLMETTGDIPEQYRKGIPLTALGGGTTGGSGGFVPPAAMQTHGLQNPPLATQETATGQAVPPPVTQAPAAANSAARSSGGKLLIGLFLLFVTCLGIVGYIAYDQGMIDFSGKQESVIPTTGDVTGASGRLDGIPAPDMSTREGFLAAFDTGSCTYNSRVEVGRHAGMVEGFATSGDVFAGLPSAYEEKFGARPSILPRQVTRAQCAALDFVRALQGRAAIPVQMQLDADRLMSGEAVTARINDGGASNVWVVLISPKGGVYNLTDRLSEPVGQRRVLRFGLNLTPGAAAASQLVLAVATEAPLVRAAAAKPGAQVAELLPLILTEIAGKGGDGSATLGYLLLEPAPQEPTEQQAPPEGEERPELPQ